MLRRIIVGTDGSDVSRRALLVAFDLAAGLKVRPEIDVVSAVDYIELGGLTQAPSAAPDLLAEAADDALAAATELAAERGLAIWTHRIEGHPAPVLMDFAYETDAGLIVVGTHGRRGLTHAMLGSVCERILRESRIPVLVVR